VADAIVEEFQAHLSGPGRRGRITVEEDDDVYKIVLDACGSGGAMRRTLAAASIHLATIKCPTSITWSIDGVPPYCSHCAQNELTAFARVGRLLWITDFSPDPSRPCAWVVFKDATRVPEAYYRRLALPLPKGES
jgi:hypothetical protein